MRASQLSEASMEQMDVIHQKTAEADKSLFVTFNLEPHLNQTKTSQEGRPIYEEKEYIMIMVPGDKDSIVHRPVSDMDKMRFADRYDRWVRKVGDERLEGTPLKAVGFLNGAQIKELEFFNCYSVEQLAAMSDANASKFLGMHNIRQRARDYVQAAKDAAPLASIRAELETKDSQLAAALQAIQEQGERIKQLEEAGAAKKT
jgi:hypothetical protein